METIKELMAGRQRGDGRIFLRGEMCWIGYYRHGHEIKESAKTTDPRKALKLLNQRIQERTKPNFVDPSREKRLTLDDLEAAIKADYVRHGRRSWETVENCLKPVRAFFKYDTLLEIGARIRDYQDARLKEKASRGSVNLESAYLRRGFKLLLEEKQISSMPVIKLLKNPNAREGFLNPADFEAVLGKIPSDDVRDIIEFLYACAWRSGEAMSLTWDKFDSHDWVFRLSRKNEKTGHPRTLVLVGALKEIIARRLAKRLPECRHVFHRNGKPMKSFLKAFKAGCKAAGITGLVVHDLRRSAVRNLRRAGNDEHDCMAISGHKTRAIFDRYDIIDENDQRRALEKQERYRKRQAQEGRKVVRLRQAG